MYEKKEHSSRRDRVSREDYTRHGKIKPIKGRGFRGPSIFNDVGGTVVERRYIEIFDDRLDSWVCVLDWTKTDWQVEQALRVRDVTWPKGRVILWRGTLDGEGEYTAVHYPRRR